MTKTVLFVPLVYLLNQAPTADPITCVLTEPVDGSTVSGTIKVTALCSLNVVKVEFYANGRLIGTAYKAPDPPYKFRRASR